MVCYEDIHDLPRYRVGTIYDKASFKKHSILNPPNENHIVRRKHEIKLKSPGLKIHALLASHHFFLIWAHRFEGMYEPLRPTHMSWKPLK